MNLVQFAMSQPLKVLALVIILVGVLSWFKDLGKTNRVYAIGLLTILALPSVMVYLVLGGNLPWKGL